MVLALALILLYTGSVRTVSVYNGRYADAPPATEAPDLSYDPVYGENIEVAHDEWPPPPIFDDLFFPEPGFLSSSPSSDFSMENEPASDADFTIFPDVSKSLWVADTDSPTSPLTAFEFIQHATFGGLSRDRDDRLHRAYDIRGTSPSAAGKPACPT